MPYINGTAQRHFGAIFGEGKISFWDILEQINSDFGAVWRQVSTQN